METRENRFTVALLGFFCIFWAIDPAHAKKIELSEPESYVLPSGEVIQRESGAFMDRRYNNSLWIGTDSSRRVAWYFYDKDANLLEVVSPSFLRQEDAAKHFWTTVEKAGLDAGMQPPLYSKECLEHRERCESLDLNDEITQTVFKPGHLWAWYTIPATLPVTLAADLVWDTLKDLWVMGDNLVQTRMRFALYHVIWRSHHWVDRLTYRPEIGRKLAHRHIEFLKETLKAETNDSTQSREP